MEVLDLRHAGARQMRPLLEDEARVWEQALRWDYRASTELLLGYLDSRILPGYVALNEGVPEGFAFGVFEAQKAVVGDCFSRSAFRRPLGDEGHDATLTRLLTNLLELLRATPGIDRIESQLLLLPTGALRSIFEEHSFQIFPRLFMERTFPPAADAPVLHRSGLDPTTLAAHGLSLRRWDALDFDAAAHLIYTAYKGHVDARINDQYRSSHGSLRFLHNIVRFPGCGTFEESQSWVLERDGSPGLAGLLLCSRIASNVAHITQLCLDPAVRGAGLGAGLLASGLLHLERAGYEAVSLTVTEENHGAVNLYTRAGFATRRRFDAAALDLA